MMRQVAVVSYPVPGIPELRGETIMLRDTQKNYFFDTLKKGEYNLLLGAGVSLDSINIVGDNMKSGSSLQSQLESVLGAKNNTPLTRLAKALTDQQKDEFLTQAYRVKLPGNTLKQLPHYIWNRIYTFNIDNVLETIYSSNHKRKQDLDVVNFTSPYTTPKTVKKVQHVHLHGFVGEPKDGYVFSINDYVSMIKDTNPWMLQLSEVFMTEPFIISGASLNETDLEFYLSKRRPSFSKNSNAPSILVEPFPDSIIEAECDKLNIILIKATMIDFLSWVYSNCKTPPTVEDIYINPSRLFAENTVSNRDELQFYVDFEILQFSKVQESSLPSTFFFGSEPTVSDINQDLDIERKDCFEPYEKIYTKIIISDKPSVFVINNEAFTGKSTFALRILEKLAANGLCVVHLKNSSRIDVENTVFCLKHIGKKVVIWVDDIADRIMEINEILSKSKSDVYALGTCRDYRFQKIEDTASTPVFDYSLSSLTNDELKKLVERYRSHGLLGNISVMDSSVQRSLLTESIGVAICRIMNDFRPLRDICYSLINDNSDEEYMFSYLVTAIAQYSYSMGVGYNILQSLVGKPIAAQIDSKIISLRLVKNNLNNNYLLCQNDVISQQVLEISSKDDNNTIYRAMVSLSKSLAPFVNRQTIRRQIPESRTSRRLMNYKEVVSKYIDHRADEFYKEIKPEWEWNSRYWEQRALSLVQRDIDLSLQFARHAVTVEEHPFTLNTLATILSEKMAKDMRGAMSLYAEILDALDRAFRLEHYWKRITIYPLTTLASSTISYIRLGFALDNKQKAAIHKHIESVTKSSFINDKLRGMLDDLNRFL